MTNLQIFVDSTTVQKIFLFGFLSFMVSMLLTPLYTTAAITGKWWKKPPKLAQKTKNDAKLAQNIPTMAGAIIVLSALIVTVAGNLSRVETWLPLAALVGAGAIGLLGDIVNIRGVVGGIAGNRTRFKSLLLIIIALIGGWWFYSKLGVHSVDIPFLSVWHLGWLIIPLFVLVVFSTANAVHITDGLDGLAGGLAAIAFGAYAIISVIEKKYGLSGFCMTIVGALLSYTWFNIYPARFVMGDIGSFALGTALGVVAMLTDTVFILPIIAFVFLAEISSAGLQMLSDKLWAGKKILLASPIHHHFEEIGWPQTKVTMRFWIIGQVSALVGVVIFILGGP